MEPKGIMTFLLCRVEENDKETLGHMFALRGRDIVYRCVTLEPPWKNNARNISCIPKGKYRLKVRHSKKFGEHLIVDEVSHRSYILLHAGNLYRHTRGCILPGRVFGELNNDGYIDVLNSRPVLESLVSLAKQSEEVWLDVQ